MAGKFIRYFAGGNTAQGFYTLFNSCFQDVDKLFILMGGPGTGKSTIMEEIGEIFADKGFLIEQIHSAFENGSIDGVKIPDLKVGIVDGAPPLAMRHRAFGVIEQYVDLGRALDSKKLQIHKEEIIQLNEKIHKSIQKAYSTFAEALKAHDELENIYIENMDFQKSTELAEQLIQKFFKNQTLHKKAKVARRFLGAATPDGPVDFIPNLTEDVANRYFIKGRPGSGKSTILKRIAAEGEQRGYDVEIYHCGFDPKSVDMVIIRELDFAIFDSTAPHEYFPERKGDEIVELYGTVIKGDTDEKYEEEITLRHGKYKGKMKEAAAYLVEAKSLKDELRKIYTEATDFSIVNKIKEDLLKRVKM